MARKRATPLITDFDNISADALIPEDEQPYEIPEHWKWVRWGSLGDLISGSGFPKQHQGKKDGAYPFFKVGTLKDADGDGCLAVAADSISEVLRLDLKAKLIPEGSLIFAKIGEAIKLSRRAVVTVPCCIDNNMFAFIPTKVLDIRFLQAWSDSVGFYQYSTATAVPSIRKSTLESVPFPLPPIDEQKAIVEKLQATNQKIDDVLERLDQYLDQASQQRAGIIQAGVAGNLTKEWREQNGRSREDWVKSTLGDTFRWSSGGTPARSNKAYFQGDIPWVKSGELPDGLISSVTEHITEEAISNSSAKVFPKDSVAIAMYGATIGRTGILGFDAATNQAVAVAAKNEEVDSRLLFHFLQASREEFVNLGKGGAQPNISQTIIKSFPFEYPVGDEQGEIVAAIEAVLSGIETTYKIALDVREKVQTAKRVVRSRALRGLV